VKALSGQALVNSERLLFIISSASFMYYYNRSLAQVRLTADVFFRLFLVETFISHHKTTRVYS